MWFNSFLLCLRLHPSLKTTLGATTAQQPTWWALNPRSFFLSKQVCSPPSYKTNPYHRRSTAMLESGIEVVSAEMLFGFCPTWCWTSKLENSTLVSSVQLSYEGQDFEAKFDLQQQFSKTIAYVLLSWYCVTTLIVSWRSYRIDCFTRYFLFFLLINEQ